MELLRISSENIYLRFKATVKSVLKNYRKFMASILGSIGFSKVNFIV